jgi:hypothetical protein
VTALDRERNPRPVEERDSVAFTIPVRTVSELNRRDHWLTRHKRSRQHRHEVAWAWLWLGGTGRRVVVPLPVVVTLTRIGPRKLDDDAVPGALKYVRDELAVPLELRKGPGGFADDSDPRVTWKYAQRSEGRGKYAVEVYVTRAVA